MFRRWPTKRAEDISPGDVVMFLNDPHVIVEVEEYNGPFDFIIGIARAGDGWGISLEARTRLEVARYDSRNHLRTSAAHSGNLGLVGRPDTRGYGPNG
jgi:hypothetical protein